MSEWSGHPIYLPTSRLLFALLLLLLLPLVLLIHIGAAGIAFAKLGIPPIAAVLTLLLALAGSGVNLKVYEREVVEEWHPQTLSGLLAYLLGFPRLLVRKQIICVNVGGALVPLLVCAYIAPKLPRDALIPLLASVAFVTIISKALSRFVPGVGIVLPGLVPPFASALCAILLYPPIPAPIAFISGVLGTLIGADLLNLPKILSSNRAVVLSVGGAGVFDGIFLTGVLAALLS